MITMKRIILIPAVLVAISGFAQTQCSTDNSLFKFDNAGTTPPKTISKLGTAPEFPFLRNMANPKQVAAAIKRNDEKNTAGMTELNDMLTNIGFTNGAKDVEASNITAYYIPSGTEGNMGSAGYSTAYCKLDGDATEFKSWKITSGSGCYMYVLAKCGNAFYPNTEHKTACINVPVNLSGDMKEVTLNSSGQKVTTTDDVYVYYHRKRHRHATEHPIAEISDPYPSKPLLVSATQDVQTVPESYKVTVNPTENSVTVCPDSTLNLTANINVEKTSEYGGYYPSKDKKEYKQISKRKYKRTARKMRKIDRKEAKVAHLTGVKVNQCAVATK